VDVVWFATMRRYGLTIRRNPAIFSMTDGNGRLDLGPRSTLDPDDSAAQMIFHEICHWITNGEKTLHERDWGFALDADLDWREHACLRLQAALSQVHGLRLVLAPTSQFRAYYDALPTDPFGPMEQEAPPPGSGWPHEDEVIALAREAVARAAGAPFSGPLQDALRATAGVRAALVPLLRHYATDIDDDVLPSLWSR
jgi:hypothetical protein